MKTFWCLFKMNFLRIINTWMIKFLLIVCIGGIGIACIVFQHQVEVKAPVSGESSIVAEKSSEIKNNDDTFTVFMIATIVIYAFIIVCGGAITSSVALEKVSKVSELLVYRISSLKIIYAKIAALFASVLLIVGASGIELIIIQRLGVMPPQVLMLKKMLGGISEGTMVLLAADICLGIYLYTLLYTMVGMTVMDAEQLQYAQLPATIILFISYGLGFYSCFKPESLLAKICFFIPPAAPFVAPSMIMSKTVGSFEVAVSIIIVSLFAIVCNVLIVKYFIPNRDLGLMLRKAGR